MQIILMSVAMNVTVTIEMDEKMMKETKIFAKLPGSSIIIRWQNKQHKFHIPIHLYSNVNWQRCKKYPWVDTRYWLIIVSIIIIILPMTMKITGYMYIVFESIYLYKKKKDKFPTTSDADVSASKICYGFISTYHNMRPNEYVACNTRQ